MKIKFKCNHCGTVYYNHIKTKNRKKATRYKKIFENDNNFIHNIFEGGCKCEKENVENE